MLPSIAATVRSIKITLRIVPPTLPSASVVNPRVILTLRYTIGARFCAKTAVSVIAGGGSLIRNQKEQKIETVNRSVSNRRTSETVNVWN